MADVSVLARQLSDFECQVQGCYWSQAQFEQTLSNESVRLYPYYHEKRLIAYLLVQVQVDLAEILQITVAPTYWRQGIASELLQALLSVARHEHWERILLEVRESNVAAIRCYEKLGYQRDGIRKAYYPTSSGERENAILMSLTC